MPRESDVLRVIGLRNWPLFRDHTWNVFVAQYLSPTQIPPALCRPLTHVKRHVPVLAPPRTPHVIKNTLKSTLIESIVIIHIIFTNNKIFLFFDHQPLMISKKNFQPLP